MYVNVLLIRLVSCFSHHTESLGEVHLSWKLSYKSLQSLNLCVPYHDYSHRASGQG